MISKQPSLTDTHLHQMAHQTRLPLQIAETPIIFTMQARLQWYK